MFFKDGNRVFCGCWFCLNYVTSINFKTVRSVIEFTSRLKIINFCVGKSLNFLFEHLKLVGLSFNNSFHLVHHFQHDLILSFEIMWAPCSGFLSDYVFIM